MARDRHGWVCLHRALLDHPIWRSVPKDWLRVFLAILLNANWRAELWWDGRAEIEIPAGSLATSVAALSKEARTKPDTTRGALRHFQETKVITIAATTRYSLITLCNWERYQNEDESEPKPTPKPTPKQTPNGSAPEPKPSPDNITLKKQSEHFSEKKKKGPHCCPAIRQTDSVGYGYRLNHFRNHVPERPAKQGFSRKA